MCEENNEYKDGEEEDSLGISDGSDESSKSEKHLAI